MDVFSYENAAKTSGEVASADLAAVTIGNSGPNALVQSVRVAYSQKIEEVTQVGSTQVYWMPGRPSGEINISSLVGTGGFFAGWTGACGLITALPTIKVSGGTNQACNFKGDASLSFDGAVVETLSLELTSERQTITQGAKIRVASMSTSGGGSGSPFSGGNTGAGDTTA